MTAPRVLLFAPWVPPHRNSEAIVTGKLLLALLARGWRFDVCGSVPLGGPGAGGFAGVWGPLEPFTHLAAAHGLPALARVRARVEGVVRTGHPVRGIAWVAGALRTGRALARRGGYDLIMSRSQPAEGHLPALALARGTGLPWVATWNDLEPAARAPRPYGSGPGASVPFFFMRYLRAVARRASHHVFPCEGARRHMERVFPEMAGRTSVIPHIALDPGRLGGVAAEGPPAGKFVVCHAGTFDAHRDPAAFFEGLLRFLGDRPDAPVEVLMLGASARGRLADSIPQALRGRVREEAWVGYEATLRRLRGASVLLMVEALMEEPVWLSGKFADYVQTGRPILALASPGSEISVRMRERGGGEAVAADDAEAVRGALARLFASWEGGSLERDYPIGGLREVYGEAAVTGGYERIVRECTAGRRAS